MATWHADTGGASTVALAIAEGVASDRSVQLIEHAAPARPGLVAASRIELGAEGTWWRRGRRGRLHAYRLARLPAETSFHPHASRYSATGVAVVVMVAITYTIIVVILDSRHSSRTAGRLQDRTLRNPDGSPSTVVPAGTG